MANALLQVAPVPSLSKAMQSGYNIKGMQTRNALLSQQLKDYPEERAWIKEKREIERDEYEYTKHLRKFKTSLEPLVKLKALDEMLRLVSNKTTLSNHDAVTENVYRQLGIDESMAQNRVTAAQIAQQAQAAGQDPETYYQQVYKPQSLMKWDQQFELMKAQIGKKPNVGKTRTIQKGTETITEEWDGTEWKKIGRGPKFKPSEAAPHKKGATRKFQQGDKVITQEWTGKEWKELGKGPKFKETKKKDNLKDLSKNYFQAIGRANSAQLKVGQFIADPNSEAVAQQEYERAKTILDQYKEAGGNLADLGIVEQSEVSLRDQAIEILQRNNKLVNEETITKVMDRIEKNK